MQLDLFLSCRRGAPPAPNQTIEASFTSCRRAGRALALAHRPPPTRLNPLARPRVALAARASAAGAQHDTAASHVLRFNLPDEHERAPSDRERGERARSMTRCPSHGATRAMDRSTGRSRRVPSRARTHASEGEANPGRARHGSLRLSDPSYVARHPAHCCSAETGRAGGGK